jgi:hypothetical protein
MQLLVPIKSILTSEGRRCNHGSGILVLQKQPSEGARSSLEEARSDPRRCKISTPESSYHIGVTVLASGMAAKVQIRNQRM